MKAKTKIVKWINSIFVFIIIITIGCTDENLITGDLQVKTLDASEITVSSALLKGETNGITKTMLARGVCYNLTGSPTIQNDKVSVIKGTGEYSITVYELAQNVTYHIRAFAIMDTTVVYGEEKSFITQKSNVPTLTLAQATSVTSISAFLAGEITSSGGFTIIERGFCWSTLSMPTINDKKIALGTDLGSYSTEVQSLIRNTKYYVRAYAKSFVGVGYSDEQSFTTLDLAQPEISSVTVSNVGMASFDVKATITNPNGIISEKGFCISSTIDPTIADNSIKVDGSILSTTFTNLKPKTNYYVRAYAKSEGGIGYSPSILITTTTYVNNLVTVTLDPAIAVKIGYLSTIDDPFHVNQSVGRSTSKIPSNAYLTSYKVGKYEVTNSEFAVFMNQYNSSTVKDGTYIGNQMISSECKVMLDPGSSKWIAAGGSEDFPVAGVTWFGANAFCTFYGGFLPTEAQWECAARGNDFVNMTSYSGSNTLNDVAVNGVAPAVGAISKVGTKMTNQLGLYDMSGNVSEWCHEWYGNYTSTFSEATSNSTNQRSLRGGSFAKIASTEFRCVNRSSQTATDGLASTGFRFFTSAE